MTRDVKRDHKAVQTSFEDFIDQANDIINDKDRRLRKLDKRLQQSKDQNIALRESYNDLLAKRDQGWLARCQQLSGENSQNAAKIKDLTSELARKRADLERVRGERLDSVDDYHPLLDADLKEPFLELRTKVKRFVTKHCKACDKLPLEEFEKSWRNFALAGSISLDMWDTERRAIAQSVIWRCLFQDILTDPVKVFLYNLTEIERLRQDLVFSMQGRCHRHATFARLMGPKRKPK